VTYRRTLRIGLPEYPRLLRAAAQSGPRDRCARALALRPSRP
jgi:hypothetical protein